MRQLNTTITPVARPFRLPGPPPPALGRIAAGAPLEAVEDRQRAEFRDLFDRPGRYALRVGDDSMMACGIFSGDIVVIQSLREARNGDIVAALVDDEPLALHRVRLLGDRRIRLFADTPGDPVRDLDCSRVSIQGKVVGQLRRYP